MNRLQKRESQAELLANGDMTEENPLIEAQDFPNRFETLSFFFAEGDGVEIVKDLDNEEADPIVSYFHDSGKIELTKGSLYEWAMERWNEQ